MNIISKLNLVLILIGISISQLFGQFEIQAEYRPRFEFRDGAKTLLSDNDNPAFVTSQRSRLNIGYNHDEIEIYLSLQDVRVWGDEVYKTDNAVINVYQAYAGYSFTDKLSLKLGRQEISYDNKRIFGSRNWNNVGASHNLARLLFEKDDFSIHYAFAYNNDSDKKKESNYSLDYYKYLTYLRIHKSFGKTFSVSIYDVVDGYQKDGSDEIIYDRFTSGIYCKGNTESNKLGFDGAFYYQYGTSTGGDPISAYYFSVGPYIKPTEKLKTTLAIEYLSGDNALNDNGRMNSFDKLYGNGHSPYGYMDYFTELPKNTNNGGLMDTYLQVDFAASPKISTQLTAHNFRLTNNIIDTLTNPTLSAANKQLGIEIDLKLKYKLHKAVALEVGYSTMFANKTMEILKGGDAERYQQWAWLMFTFKPTLFKHEFKTEEN